MPGAALWARSGARGPRGASWSACRRQGAGGPPRWRTPCPRESSPPCRVSRGAGAALAMDRFRSLTRRDEYRAEGGRTATRDMWFPGVRSHHVGAGRRNGLRSGALREVREGLGRGDARRRCGVAPRRGLGSSARTLAAWVCQLIMMGTWLIPRHLIKASFPRGFD